MGGARESGKRPRGGHPAAGKGALGGGDAAGGTGPGDPPPARPAGFVCPYCRAELSWETLGSVEAEVTIYVREKVYFCPRCRAFLGISSWHTEG